LDLALRLAKYFKNSPEFWLNLQNRYDITKVGSDHEFQATLAKIRECEVQVDSNFSIRKI
jgi:plasmid maintenance system antidote protein VapI